MEQYALLVDDDLYLVPADECTDDVGGFWYEESDGYEYFYADVADVDLEEYDLDNAEDEDESYDEDSDDTDEDE